MELNIYKQHTETTDGQKTINETLNTLFSRAGIFAAVMLVLTLCAGTAGAADMEAPQIELPEGASTDWWTAVQEDIRTSEYDVIWQEKTQLSDLNAAYQAPNRAHNLRTYFAPESIRITPRESTDWAFGLSLVGYGFADDVLSVSEAEMSVSENRVEYRRCCLTEWYVNREDGLEQGFTIDSPPESGSQGSEKESWIAINMDIFGDLNANMNSASDAIEFTTTGGVGVLRYSKLYAFDAAGRELDARFTLSESTIGILVNASGAAYPITIDPLAQSPAWTAESNQNYSYFGISVAGAGDVNGDGYSDAIVGAYNYDNGQSDEGRAYVYHGSASCTCGDICVNETGWWRDGGTFNASGTPVQAAVDNATAGETICVRDGTYNENVDVGVVHLTIRSQNGSANCIVDAASSGDHVFYVQQDYVNISGFTVENATCGCGIHLYGASNCAISDSIVLNNRYGIYLQKFSNNNVIINNTASFNDWYTIILENSSNNTIDCNNVSNSDVGILISSSSNNNTISNNEVSNNDDGIYLYESCNDNIVANNNASNNYYEGIRLVSSSSNNAITGNTASNNRDGISLESSSNNNTLASNTANSNSQYGIYLCDSSNNNTLTSNNASSNDCGIRLYPSSNNTLTNNTASNNNYGIYMSSSSNNTLTNNTADSNDWYGINLRSSSNNTLTNNTANSNGDGIYLSSSSNNTLTENTASSNDGGGIYLSSSSNNTLTSNNASSNDWCGIHLYSSSNNNTIYNNYLNNTNNAWDDGNNIWNTTPTPGTNIIGGSWLGGNYWSDYTGVDDGGDRLGDTMLPYNSSGSIAYGGDWHPLTQTQGGAPPAIISWSNDKTNDDSLHITVNESESVRFNATADQTITTWNWFKDGVDQSNNNDNYTTSWSVSGTHNVSVNATNANGTSDMKTWTITVNDVTAPVVNTVTLNTTAPNTGDAILVTVDATDNAGVTGVTADGFDLIPQGGNIWSGTITAIEGTHSVNVSAEDAAGNTGWNNSTSYTATDAPVLTTIMVSPSAANLTIGETQLFTATAYDQDGAPMAGIVLTWTSTNTDAGTVDPLSATTDADGIATTTFTAVAEGATTVAANNGSVYDTATVTVTPPLPNVTITTDASTYSPGDTMIVTLDIANPTSDPVTFEWYIGVPQHDIWVTYARASIPAGFDNSYAIPIQVGNWGPTSFNLVHYVRMLDPVSGDVLVYDVAWCTYSPGAGEAMPVDIAEEISKTVEAVEFSI